MNNQFNFYSFEQFCIDINRTDILDLWDYDLNDKSPKDVGYSSIMEFYFKCPRGIHESRKISLNNLTKALKQGKDYTICLKCNSLGQYIVDNYGEEYLNKIWSDKNEKSPYDYSRRTYEKIWLVCQNDETHPDYDLIAGNFKNSHNCPYCAGKRVCYTNSLGYKMPKAVELWSDKNEKTPFDYTSGSHAYVWWKCDNDKHDDYQRKICGSTEHDYKCPICGKENQHILRGEEHPNWKGNAVPENRRIRWSPEYKEWRNKVYEKDNYVCQCCGTTGGRLNGHHINDFATYEDQRFDEDNGITLCVNCHDATIPGSFHNVYGTHGKTEQELEEYINNKRKELGINIPFSIEEYRNGNILKPGDVENAYLDDLAKVAKPSPKKQDSKFIKIKPRYRV